MARLDDAKEVRRNLVFSRVNMCGIDDELTRKDEIFNELFGLYKMWGQDKGEKPGARPITPPSNARRASVTGQHKMRRRTQSGQIIRRYTHVEASGRPFRMQTALPGSLQFEVNGCTVCQG